jgi:hypothetical protein
VDPTGGDDGQQDPEPRDLVGTVARIAGDPWTLAVLLAAALVATLLLRGRPRRVGHRVAEPPPTAPELRVRRGASRATLRETGGPWLGLTLRAPAPHVTVEEDSP